MFKGPNYHHMEFIEKNASSIGFVILYNKISENKMLMGPLFDKSSLLTVMPSREVTYRNGTKETQIIKGIDIDDYWFKNSWFKGLIIRDFYVLEKMGYEILKERA